MSRGFLRGGGLASVLAIMMLAAGCGSSNSSSSSSAASSASGSASNASATSGALATAKAAVAAAENVNAVKEPQPTTSFNPGSGTMAVISCGNAGVDCLHMSEAAVAAAQAMGWKTTGILDGKFAPATQAGYVQQAIQQHDAGIVLVSIDTSTIKAAVDAAAAAHIPVSCVMCVGDTGHPVIDATTGGNTEGKMVGNWIVDSSGGKPVKILVFNDKSFPIVGIRQAGAEAVIKALCPKCTVMNEDFPTTDLTKPGPPTWTAALSANPKGTLQWVLAPYDPAAIPMAKTAIQDGRTEIKMIGYDASPETVQSIASGGQVMSATTGSPELYAAWAAVDEVAREHAGKPTWDATHLVPALVTNTDASSFKAGFFSPPGFDYAAMFKKLWGK